MSSCLSSLILATTHICKSENITKSFHIFAAPPVEKEQCQHYNEYDCV